MRAAKRSGLAGAAAAVLAGCGAPAPPEAVAPPRAVTVSAADEGYGGCADPVRLTPDPPADAETALALVRAFVAQLRGPAGEPVRARRLGAGVCEGVTDRDLALLDFWIIGDRTVVFAPLAPGEPAAPAGLALLSS
jgi:hypothetical protein